MMESYTRKVKQLSEKQGRFTKSAIDKKKCINFSLKNEFPTLSKILAMVNTDRDLPIFSPFNCQQAYECNGPCATRSAVGTH
jgi:hypothetical protein